jgi:hypothetical protein
MISQTRIAQKVIPQSQFDSLAQMQRYRRLVEKYRNSPLILLGDEIDFINAAIAFKHVDRIDMSGICKLAAYENMFTTFKKTNNDQINKITMPSM